MDSIKSWVAVLINLFVADVKYCMIDIFEWIKCTTNL